LRYSCDRCVFVAPDVSETIATILTICKNIADAFEGVFGSAWARVRSPN
jgi:hypothetical protein